MSEASDPVAMRTSELRGARHVGSTTYQIAVDAGLGDDVEVHRVQAGGIHRHDARRDVVRPQERRGEMGEVTAHAFARRATSRSRHRSGGTNR